MMVWKEACGGTLPQSVLAHCPDVFGLKQFLVVLIPFQAIRVF
jgi:hypothetical protein